MDGEATINEQQRLATFERIAGYTVGVAVEKNTGIGTGTLITDGTNRYVLTAAYVIGGAEIGGAHFWLRPSSALMGRDGHTDEGRKDDAGREHPHSRNKCGSFNGYRASHYR